MSQDGIDCMSRGSCRQQQASSTMEYKEEHIYATPPSDCEAWVRGFPVPRKRHRAFRAQKGQLTAVQNKSRLLLLLLVVRGRFLGYRIGAAIMRARHEEGTRVGTLSEPPSAPPKREA